MEKLSCFFYWLPAPHPRTSKILTENRVSKTEQNAPSNDSYTTECATEATWGQIRQRELLEKANTSWLWDVSEHSREYTYYRSRKDSGTQCTERLAAREEVRHLRNLGKQAKPLQSLGQINEQSLPMCLVQRNPPYILGSKSSMIVMPDYKFIFPSLWLRLRHLTGLKQRELILLQN